MGFKRIGVQRMRPFPTPAGLSFQTGCLPHSQFGFQISRVVSACLVSHEGLGRFQPKSDVEQYEIPNCYLGDHRLSGCGRLGALFLLNVPKSDNSSRTGCVESHPSNSTNRARQFSSPLRHWCLLGSSCQFCYVWIGQSDRGNSPAESKSCTIKRSRQVVEAAWTSPQGPATSLTRLRPTPCLT